MSSEANKLNSQDNESIKVSNSQRKCLSHILRNCDQAISGLMDLIDDPYSNLKLGDLKQVLPNVCKELEQVLSAAQKGTFCALHGNECKYVSYFVGCDGIPDLGQLRIDHNKSGSSRLNILDT
jgi:hypothetical protein